MPTWECELCGGVSVFEGDLDAWDLVEEQEMVAASATVANPDIERLRLQHADQQKVGQELSGELRVIPAYEPAPDEDPAIAREFNQHLPPAPAPAPDAPDPFDGLLSRKRFKEPVA